MTIDPEMLMAYADGELDPLSAKRVEKAMAADPALAERVAAHRALRATLAGHFAPVAQQPVPARLAALLDDAVVPIRAAPARRRNWLSAGNLAAMAATLVIGLLAGRMLEPAGPVASRQGSLVAQGSLAQALDTQLASAPAAGAATRIGLTFRDPEGALCRTFEDRALSGIACRAAGEWTLRRTMSGDAAQGAYRQAGSAETMEAAQAMMAGDPLDAAAERAARDGGWR